MATGLGLLPRIDALGGGLVPLAQALLPVMVLIYLVLAVLTAVTRRALAAAILVGGVVVGSLPLVMPVYDAAAAPANSDTERLTVFSLNLEYSEADAAAVASVINQEAAQLVVLLECDEAFVERLAQAGGLDALPYRTGQLPGVGAEGSIILSAWPLRDLDQVPAGDPDWAFQQPSAVVAVPGIGEVQIAAVHTLPPLGGGMVWRSGLRQIGAWQRSQGRMPLIMAGDFNASTAHVAFRHATAGLTNTAVVGPTGRLPLPTWPSGVWFPPFTAIDHILVRGLAPIDWHRVTVDGTDHRGIIARVVPISGELATATAPATAPTPSASPTPHDTSTVPPSGTLPPSSTPNEPALVSAEWVSRDEEGGRTLMVVPAPWVRDALRIKPSFKGTAALADLWAELVAMYPEANTTSMHHQLTCHGLGAVDKASWNLEPWRPDVGLVATIKARCNP